MDWGTELWDQFDNVDKHHQHGIDSAEKYAKFVKERCAIEVDYAARLRKLVKSYQPKKKVEDRSMFSTHKAFQTQLSELNDIAGQHEVVAEEMLSKISKILSNFCNDLKVEKKKIYQDGRNQQSTLDQHERALEQTKKKFEKEWKDCERAQAYYEKLDADGNVTKVDVEKAKHAWVAKKDSVENCKTDYGSALQIFNKEQQEHYSFHMPKLFQSYKDADERRILKTRDLMAQYANIDIAVKPIIKKCLDGMKQAADAVDATLDAQLVVDKLKSGFSPPHDKEFEDCTQPNHKPHGEDAVESPRLSQNFSRLNANKKFGWLFGNKKHPKQLKKQQSTRKSETRSSSVSDLQKTGLEEENLELEENGQSVPDKSLDKLKSRTLSFTASKTNSVKVERKTLTAGNRSSSFDVLNKTDVEFKDSVHRKSSKNKSRHHDFRISMPVNKKRLLSMFRQSKDEHVPTVEVSGPITCDLIGTGANDDYLVPISTSSPSPPTPPPSRSAPTSPETENPYDEVAVASNDDENEPGVVEAPDYSHLPPEQRRKKLQKIIEDLKKDISKEEDGRKAVMKMQEVYRSNPALGSAESVAGQIKVSTQKIEKLQAELSQHESWYADASGSAHSPSRSSLAQRTLPDKPKDTTPVKTQPLVTMSRQSNMSIQRDQSFGDDFDEEPEPIGTCEALYDFDANSDGALSMKAGETFSVIEADNGDGWTRAVKNDVDGYVPTSYIKVDFFT